MKALKHFAGWAAVVVTVLFVGPLVFMSLAGSDLSTPTIAGILVGIGLLGLVLFLKLASKEGIKAAKAIAVGIGSLAAIIGVCSMIAPAVAPAMSAAGNFIARHTDHEQVTDVYMGNGWLTGEIKNCETTSDTLLCGAATGTRRQFKVTFHGDMSQTTEWTCRKGFYEIGCKPMERDGEGTRQ